MITLGWEEGEGGEQSEAGKSEKCGGGDQKSSSDLSELAGSVGYVQRLLTHKKETTFHILVLWNWFVSTLYKKNRT